MLADLNKKFSSSYRSLARQMGLSYATLMRWKQRVNEGKPAVGKPGPKKVAPLDLSQLKKRIENLDHGAKRSRGTERLHGAFSKGISRRDLNRLIEQVRHDCKRQRSAQTCRVAWLRPNLAWAMDDCRKQVTGGSKLHLHNLSDLCSRYKLPPLASDHLPCGEEVAGHLDRLFSRFGPPLFIKRDNGGSLNNLAVDRLLADAMVIPINSPVYTPSYNGAIERTQGEFKAYLRSWQWKAKSHRQCAILAEIAAHDLNHRFRRSLGGKTACRVYFGKTRMRYPKRQRQAVFQWICGLAARISTGADENVITPAALRIAAKQWLVKNGLIRIVKAGKVLPNFSLKLSHN